MITINTLTKKFKKISAVDNLTISFQEGDFCALLGANGAGKSSLLRLMVNLEHADSGSCQYEGVDISEDNVLLKSKIAYIDENIHFHHQGSVEKFLLSYKSFYSTYSTWDDRLLRHLFDNNFINKNAKFEELSRGQKVQLILAASLARKPKYIFIDEATAVMDIFIRAFFMDFLEKYARENRAIVIVATNIISELDFIANKILMLKDGKKILFDDYEKVKSHFIKIRKRPQAGLESSLFSLDKKCVWLNKNSDGTSSYIMRKEDFHLNEKEMQGIINDKREILISEIFSYINSSQRG